MNGNQSAKTMMGEDVEVVGSIKSASSIQIDGKLSGDLTCSGNAIIGASAHIKGNLSVDSVTVHGQINGNINAKDRIELKSTANLNGDIRGKRLSVEDGVTFIGKSEVNPSGGAAAQRVPAAAEQPAAQGPDEGGEAGPGKGKGGVLGKK